MTKRIVISRPAILGRIGRFETLVRDHTMKGTYGPEQRAEIVADYERGKERLLRWIIEAAICGASPEEPSQFLIWSEEHNAWWNPNRAGYTKSMSQAGRYTRTEAEAIVKSANYGMAFNEALVPLTPAMEEAMALKERGR